MVAEYPFSYIDRNEYGFICERSCGDGSVMFTSLLSDTNDHCVLPSYQILTPPLSMNSFLPLILIVPRDEPISSRPSNCVATN